MDKKYLIYLATNIANNKKYVGQTQVDRYEKRISEHIQAIPYTKQTCIFHAALDKYGIDNFKFDIIETNIPIDKINAKEQYYIEYYNTYYKNNQGYNMTLGGQGTFGYVFTESDREKISRSSYEYWKALRENNPEAYHKICKHRSDINIGKHLSEETKEKLRRSRIGKAPWNKGLVGVQISKYKDTSSLPKVLMFDLKTGVLLNEFVSVQNLVRSLWPNLSDQKRNTKSSRISLICKNEKGHAYGYIWRYETNYKNINELSQEELEAENRPARAKKVQKFTYDNKLVCEYTSAAEASRELSCNMDTSARAVAKAISNACLNSKAYLGFFWKYKV